MVSFLRRKMLTYHGVPGKSFHSLSAHIYVCDLQQADSETDIPGLISAGHGPAELSFTLVVTH